MQFMSTHFMNYEFLIILKCMDNTYVYTSGLMNDKLAALLYVYARVSAKAMCLSIVYTFLTVAHIHSHTQKIEMFTSVYSPLTLDLFGVHALLRFREF